MKIRHVLAATTAAMTLAGALLVLGAAPALAWGHTVCTFDQGVKTCVTTTTKTITAGPFTCSIEGGINNCGTTTFGGFTVEQICQFVVGVPDTVVTFDGMTLTGTVTTMTTTKRHGMNGNVFNTSTSTTRTLDSVQGVVGCGTGG
jgi:hypothetical protein